MTAASPVKLYGIKQCDTMKKARRWLDERGIDHTFHDYKTAGIDIARLERWCGLVGWKTLLNRAGTTFRRLPEEDKHDLDAARAIALMQAHPSLIKRPVLEIGARVLVGFAANAYETEFASDR